LRGGGRRGDVEECAGSRDVLGAVGIGKEPVVADAVAPCHRKVLNIVAMSLENLGVATAFFGIAVLLLRFG
jgi:hypothetical protein